GEAGALVLEGACVELSFAVPYLPLIEALRRESLTLPAADAMLSPDLARARLFAELADRLARIGDGRPVLLMVDALQWADRSTLDALRFLVRALRGERLLLVIAARAPAAALPLPVREAWADVSRSSSAVHVSLAGLDKAEVATQLGALLGRAPEP